MIKDPTLRLAGFAGLSGMDSGSSPELIAADEVAWAVNTTFRGGHAHNRPPLIGQVLTFESSTTLSRWKTGKFQGSAFYAADSGENSLIIAQGGRLFRVQLQTTSNYVTEITIHFNVATTVDFVVPVGLTVDVTVNSVVGMAIGDAITIGSGLYTVNALIGSVLTLARVGGDVPGTTIAAGTALMRGGVYVTVWDTNPDDEFAFLFQAENYLIVFQGETRPIIYDGSTSRRARNTELPAGYCGAYIMGRIWMVLTNRQQFIAGDLVGSPSGTLGKQFRDAVLQVTDNTYLAEGGAFSAPPGAGLITAIGATVILDTSLGQGPVTIGCTNAILTCNAPADRTLWASLTWPIQTIAAIDYGPLAARGLMNVNADLWYRATNGMNSFIVARRNFNVGWGNTPMSFEMNRVLEKDTEALLFYGSGVLFDNRLIYTCSPHRTSAGISHRALAVINFDEVSSLRRKTDPAWEGIWTGLNVLQILKGSVRDEERCWVIASTDTGLTVWELDLEGIADIYTATVGGKETVFLSRIESRIETRLMDFENSDELKMLDHAEMRIKDLIGVVDFAAEYRPDEYPGWVQWHTWSKCNTVNHCGVSCPDTKNYKPGFRPRMRLPSAPSPCLEGLDKPANLGYAFQLALSWKGHATIKRMRVLANAQLDDANGYCEPSDVVCVAPDICENSPFDYSSADGVAGGT